MKPVERMRLELGEVFDRGVMVELAIESECRRAVFVNLLIRARWMARVEVIDRDSPLQGNDSKETLISRAPDKSGFRSIGINEIVNRDKERSSGLVNIGSRVPDKSGSSVFVNTGKEGGAMMRQKTVEAIRLAGLPGVPGDRPDIAGMSRIQMGRAMRPWYERHKALIIEYLEKVGPSMTSEAWGIANQTLINLRTDWGLALTKGRGLLQHEMRAGAEEQNAGKAPPATAPLESVPDKSGINDLRRNDDIYGSEKVPPPSLGKNTIPIYIQAMPAFPEWSDLENGSTDLKVAWLRAYRDIVLGERS